MKSKTFIVGLVVIVSLVGLLVFYGTGTDQETKHNLTIAPDFTLQTLDGGTIRLADYQGEKPVVLDFWASWCHNCQRSMPKLSALYPAYKEHIEIVGVNLQETSGIAKRFIASHDISYPIVLDQSGELSNAYAVRYTNTHVLIDKQGKVVRTATRDLHKSDLDWLINL